MKDKTDTNIHSNKTIKNTPLKAIRKKCLDCCAQQYLEVRLCPVKTCPLWQYRMGKNPFRERNFTNTQERDATGRFAKARTPST